MRLMDGLVKNVEFGQAAMEHIDALYGYALTLTRDVDGSRRSRAGNISAGGKRGQPA